METMTEPRNAAMRKDGGITDFMPSNPMPATSESIRCVDQAMRILISKGVSTKMLHALTILYSEGKAERSMSMGELSLRIGISSASFTGVADGIERLGLAKRWENKNDRRLRQFKLTGSGIVFVEWITSCLYPGRHTHQGLSAGLASDSVAVGFPAGAGISEPVHRQLPETMIARGT
jgi:DNA-binding MarR family transcriptional regulator